MNKTQRLEPEDYRALQILDELSSDGSLTQRELSNRLGIALGLVNSYIKNLIKKGYITVKAIPPKRYAYYLTPRGFAEKTRLAYNLLQDYTRIYREARENLKKLFHGLEQEGVKRIVFAGADEVAEIAYLTLQETDMELVGVVDPDRAGNSFFSVKVRPVASIREMKYDVVIVATYLKRESIYKDVLGNGAKKENIRIIFK